jgi:hypothetical protein
MRRFAGNQEMENKMTTYRAPLALVLVTFAVTFGTFGCWQQIDEGASAGITPVTTTGGGIGAKFPTDTTTPEIGEVAADNGDPTSTAPNGCAKTAFDGQAILSGFCDSCHQTGSLGNLVGIDTAATSLVNRSASIKYSGWKYIVAGAPEMSLIYERVAIAGDMPPPSTSDAVVAHPSVSDMSVLRQWIATCMAAAPAGSGN